MHVRKEAHKTAKIDFLLRFSACHHSSFDAAASRERAFDILHYYANAVHATQAAGSSQRHSAKSALRGCRRAARRAATAGAVYKEAAGAREAECAQKDASARSALFATRWPQRASASAAHAYATVRYARAPARCARQHGARAASSVAAQRAAVRPRYARRIRQQAVSADAAHYRALPLIRAFLFDRFFHLISPYSISSRDTRDDYFLSRFR